MSFEVGLDCSCAEKAHLQGTRDYNLGQGPEQSVQDVAASLHIALPQVQVRSCMACQLSHSVMHAHC